MAGGKFVWPGCGVACACASMANCPLSHVAATDPLSSRYPSNPANSAGRWKSFACRLALSGSAPARPNCASSSMRLLHHKLVP